MNVPSSLRARLLAAGVIGAALIIVLATVLLGEAFRSANERAFDRALAVELDRLVAAAETGADGGVSMPVPPASDAYQALFSGQYWQVDHGALTLRSRSLWDSALTVTASQDGKVRWRDATGPNNEPLRLATRDVRLPHSRQRTQFTVAADRTGLLRDAANFRWQVAATLAVLAIVLLAVLAYQVRYVLAPLRRLSRAVAAVRAGDMTRLPTADLPAEVLPLANHVNELLGHHERTVDRARSAAQDLAHALKTPLSVLALEADRPGPDLPATLRRELARIQSAVDRQARGALAADPRQRTLIAPVAAALVEVMAKVHGPRGLAFQVAVPEGLVFAGAADDLEEMLGNLLDNAGKWARSMVTVAAGGGAGRVWLEVRDDGPGLPESQLDNVQARGVRLDEAVPGSGLGLAIIRQIAASYGGVLHLSSARPGLLARLDLPAAKA